MLWLTNATDEGVPTLKGYEWWRTAASLLPANGGGGGIAHFAKVDDDSFVHLINLEADLRRLWVRRRRPPRRHRTKRPPARPPRPRLIPRPRGRPSSQCVPQLHYGSIAFTGYDPSIWRMCGWSAARRTQLPRRRARGRARTRPSRS